MSCHVLCLLPFFYPFLLNKLLLSIPFLCPLFVQVHFILYPSLTLPLPCPQVQLGMSIETTATIQDLRQQLAEDCGIPAASLIITEVDGEGFHRTFAGQCCPFWCFWRL